MSELEIKISPFNTTSFYLCKGTSYQYGIEEGIIYAPRFSEYNLARIDYAINNDSNKFQWILESVNHECLHKILADLFDYDISTKLDNIDKNADESDYLISKIQQLNGEQIKKLNI